MNLQDAPQRIRWATFISLAGIALLLTVLDSTGNLGNAFSFLQDPMTAVLTWTAARADNVADALAGPRDLQEAHQIIAEQQAHINALERENEELRQGQGQSQIYFDLFNRVRQAPEFTRVAASVIGRDPNPGVRSIIIDRGTADGVRVGMPVESARGLVGRVFRTTANSAQVVLITDSASSVPARLGTTRATGILRGGGLGGSMIIEWIDLKHQVTVGEVVLTSGLGGQFPQDIVIGRVIEVERREADLFQKAVVQPASDFDSLEIILVITDFRPLTIEVFTDPPGN